MAGGRLGWFVWGMAMATYVVAVLDRTSFGVAGLDATRRFSASSSILASFTVMQLLLYAGCQVPVGVLLDRLGPRLMILGGSAVMAAGQCVVAVAGSVPLAVAGRAVVGAGDAAIFISVLRLVATWIPVRRIPLVTQLSGLLGQVGQVLSASFLLAVLHSRGWTAAFGAAGLLTAAVASVAAFVLRDTPDGAVPRTGLDRADILHDLAQAWRHPGTRLGLWTHFTTQFPGTVFSLLWGYPFLVSGEGLSPRAASALLTVFVVAGVVAAPVVGVAVQRHPLRRSNLVLGLVAANAGAWTAVLLWPGRAPLPLLVLLVMALALGGPGSMIGFDFARTFNPPNRLGMATGIVNVGGFVASLLTVLLIGLVLDGVGGRGGAAAASLGDFRVAMCSHYVFWIVGVAGVLRARAQVRRRREQAAAAHP